MSYIYRQRSHGKVSWIDKDVFLYICSSDILSQPEISTPNILISKDHTRYPAIYIVLHEGRQIRTLTELRYASRCALWNFGVYLFSQQDSIQPLHRALEEATTYSSNNYVTTSDFRKTITSPKHAWIIFSCISPGMDLIVIIAVASDFLSLIGFCK